MTGFSENLMRLHCGEEFLRNKAFEIIERDERLRNHLQVTELAMDLLDLLRQYPTDEEDLKTVQALGIRIFNAFASSVKLTLSGYSQNAALILRDILETSFLLDLFRSDPSAVARWRVADRQARLRDFKPVKVREMLDKRDGITGLKRAAHYELFSELAGHASMQSFAMLRPKGMDVRNGPFHDPTALKAVLAEMGKLAVQAGEIIEPFFPRDWAVAWPARAIFAGAKRQWIETFYTSGDHDAPAV